MTTEIIKEGVLNDDTLYIAEEGKIFGGGYEAILEYFTYQTHWSNNKHVRRFRTLENANKYIEKNYNLTTKGSK